LIQFIIYSELSNDVEDPLNHELSRRNDHQTEEMSSAQVLRRQLNSLKERNFEKKKRRSNTGRVGREVTDYIMRADKDNVKRNDEFEWIHFEYEEEEAKAHIDWQRTYHRLKRKKVWQKDNLTSGDVYLNTCIGHSWNSYYNNYFTNGAQYGPVFDGSMNRKMTDNPSQESHNNNYLENVHIQELNEMKPTTNKGSTPEDGNVTELVPVRRRSTNQQ